MKPKSCNCGDMRRVSAKSIADAQKVLRDSAPKPTRSRLHEESVFFGDGRIYAALAVSAKSKAPHILFVASPEALGIVVVKATFEEARKASQDQLEFELEVSATHGPAEHIERIGKATIQIERGPLGTLVSIKGHDDQPFGPIFSRKVDWNLIIECVGVCGFACWLSRFACVECVVGCVILALDSAD